MVCNAHGLDYTVRFHTGRDGFSKASTGMHGFVFRIMGNLHTANSHGKFPLTIPLKGAPMVDSMDFRNQNRKNKRNKKIYLKI